MDISSLDTDMPLPETTPQVSRIRRTYNQWAANETLEDFALRFTARRARRWTYGRVANTALGSISFLALEAIGGAITLTYGFSHAVTAILAVGLILFLTGLPIAYYAAKTSVDIDLLTRGAGFGYIGSTVTSLVYAAFTFLFFALEAAILSQALELFFGVPLTLGYLLNALIVLPLVTHGFSRIGEFQRWTQPIWIVLQIAPFIGLIWIGIDLPDWTGFVGRLSPPDGGFDPGLWAAASGVLLALMAQIGEQVDVLRFLPEPKTRRDRRAWWFAVISAGPGWAVIGTLKMLAGSLLAVLLLGQGASTEEAIDPARMYLAAWTGVTSHETAVILTVVFVLLAQVKINVTNAYAGSIAWSNFFSRLTHTHPGRVVWLFLNVGIAVLLMEFGVYGTLEHTLGLYAHVAVAWIGAITADLVINKYLRLSPRGVEFRRAHLFDINPVGVGATILATLLSLMAYLEVFGESVAAYSGLIALGVSIVVAPLIAVATRGQFYIAREPEPIVSHDEQTCDICENAFDPEDMTQCPFHRGNICSLCCGLETRCGDLCRPNGAISAQLDRLFGDILPARLSVLARSRYSTFLGIAFCFIGIVALVLLLARNHADPDNPDIDRTLYMVFGLMVVITGVAAWLLTLAKESREVANQERERETSRLQAEIRAHMRTDAELQRAKDLAVAANEAKSRYVAGISHELRTPLSAILGYAQLLENDPIIPASSQPAVRVMRRSSEHLADLIEGLLDISKIEAGKLEIVRAETRFRELVEQMSAIFRMQAQAKGLRFQYDTSGVLPARVYADEKRLRQILTNLLSNAVRYTERGHVRFEVKFRNDIATFTVEDTGRGIPEKEQERIFLPFERIEDPTAPIPGTGLGLTISKLLTEILGGELTLSSTPGAGSRFQVRLMLPRIVGPEPARRHRLFGYHGRRRRILVVDDNPDHRGLVEDALRPLGFELAMAESGETAMAIVEAKSIDLALIDVAMPGMSGWTLASKLRTECNLNAPIVMISAHANESARPPDGLRYHDDFLAKPINMDVLFECLKHHLRLEWLTEEPPLAPADKATGTTAAMDSALTDDDLQALSSAVNIGHVRGIEMVLDALEERTPDSDRFTKTARDLLNSLDLRGLADLVAEARQNAG